MPPTLICSFVTDHVDEGPWDGDGYESYPAIPQVHV